MRWIPPLVAALAFSVLGWFDLDHPIALATLGALALAGFGLALVSLPVLLFWACPVLVILPLYLPVFPYEALIVLLALPLIGSTLTGFLERPPVLDAIQWRYALFLLLVLPGATGLESWWRYLGQLKMFVIGWLAFEVTRHAVPRFGREALLWGPALFCAATFAQLGVTIVTSGVPMFKSVELRSTVSNLGWMRANGIPSTMLLCAPSMLLLVRLTPRRSWRRVAATAALVSSFFASLLVAARGPFLLAVGFLISVAVRVRRSWWVGLAVGMLILTPLLWTPMGQGLVERFTNSHALESTLFRFNSWSIAWQRGVTHMPWGLGAGQGIFQSDRLLDEDPHNFALTLFSEEGPLAMLVWFWMMWVLWRAAGRMRRQPHTHWASTALRGTIALALMNAMFDPTIKSNPMYHLFWWNLGLLEAGFLHDEANAARAEAPIESTPTARASAPPPRTARPTADS